VAKNNVNAARKFKAVKRKMRWNSTWIQYAGFMLGTLVAVWYSAGLAIARSWVRIPPAAGVHQRQLSASATAEAAKGCYICVFNLYLYLLYCMMKVDLRCYVTLCYVFPFNVGGHFALCGVMAEGRGRNAERPECRTKIRPEWRTSGMLKARNAERSDFEVEGITEIRLECRTH